MKNFLLLFLVAVAVRAQTPTPPPHPGYWHCGTSPTLHYCPCYPPPYTPWVDPETGFTFLYRYDFSPMRQPQACPGLPGQLAPCVAATAGGPNHSLTWLDPNYVERPIQRQPSTPNYYPGPAGLCDVWLANNNSGVCPDPNYNLKMKNNPTWVAGYNYSKVFMDADAGCHSGPVPTPTRTPTPTITPTPSRTPTPAPSIYADWIYQFVKEGYSSGCGPTTYCPGDPGPGFVTRAQEAVFGLKYVHGPGYVPPKCVPPGQFTDVPCR